MERIQHHEATAASQSDLAARILAPGRNNESSDRQASKLRLDRDNQDLDESISHQREEEQIVKIRKVEDQKWITS